MSRNIRSILLSLTLVLSGFAGSKAIAASQSSTDITKSSAAQTNADPKDWGMFAQLVGKNWAYDEPNYENRRREVRWTIRGESMVIKEFTNDKFYHQFTVTKTQAPGEFTVVFTYLGMSSHRTAHLQSDGSFTLARESFMKPAMHFLVKDGRWEEDGVTLDSRGAVVKVKWSNVYRSDSQQPDKSSDQLSELVAKVPEAPQAPSQSMPAKIGESSGLPDADALRMAHLAYFAGFPHDRKAVLSLGDQGNVFAAVMLERTWQLPDYGGASSDESLHWSDIALAGHAMARLSALAERGDTNAMLWLGSVQRYGLLDQAKDLAKSFAWFLKSAEHGNAFAQNIAGWMYESGEGVAKDEAEAVRWWRKAAEQGNAMGQDSLGRSFYFGYGVAKDVGQAMSLWRKAAEQGNASAQSDLGSAYYFEGEDAEQAVNWWRKAAEQGNAQAQYNLGLSYFSGTGVAKNQVEAVGWWRKAAKLGNAAAQRNLGVAYSQGIAVDMDPVQAVLWWRRAAEQGDSSSQYNLGFSYTQGIGVNKNQSEAVDWWRKAAEQGDARAQSSLGSAYYFGYGVGKDRNQAVHWWRKAAEQGNASAQYNLGQAYEYGIGIAKSSDEAVRWWRKAADQGNASAQSQLAELQRRNSLSTETAEAKPKKHGFLRSLVGAAVGVAAGKAYGASGEQVLGAALAGAATFNPDSAAAQTLGAAGEGLITSNTVGSASGVAALADGSGGRYPTKPNLAISACAGFTEDNYRQKALSGGGDQQLYTMCGQAFEYYTMYKRAIAQGYSEADANRTYAAHEQAAQVAQGFLNSHGAN